VDFIHDHPLQTFEHARCVFVRGKEGKAFRGGQQNMRWVGRLRLISAASALSGET
jgi:hypothetical protein